MTNPAIWEAQAEAARRRNPRLEYPAFVPVDVAAWDRAWSIALAAEDRSPSLVGAAPAMRIVAWWAWRADRLLVGLPGVASALFDGAMRNAFATPDRMPVEWARAIRRWWVHGEVFWEWYRRSGRART